MGSLVSGLLHRSIVLAASRVVLAHHVSHQSHASGSERKDRHLVLQVVGQVLVEVGERVWVGGERVVRRAVRVAGAVAAEVREVDDEECRDMVRPAAERARPEALLPEAEAGRGVVGRVAAEGRHRHRRAAEVEIPQLAHVGLHDLVRVDVDDLLERRGEEHVEEVPPDDALLLGLRAQPPCGHTYSMASISQPSAAERRGSDARSCGDMKTERSQNLTLRSVRCSTEPIMTRRKRSYSSPDASEKMCTLAVAVAGVMC